MKEVLEVDESIIRKEKPVFAPFVIRSIPSLLGGLFVVFLILISASQSHDGGIPLFDEKIEVPLMLLVFLGLALLKVLYEFIRPILIYPNTEYAFTETKVVLKSGFFGIDYKTIDYDQISDIEVRVNPIEKLFSVGTIKIYTGRVTEGGRKETDDIVAIRDPYRFFKEINKTKTDVKTDWSYPNALRPDENPGYKTKYKPDA